MNYTNRYNIKSRALQNALRYDGYDLEKHDNVYSVTALIDAPIQRILKDRFDGELVSDISDNAWILFGKSVHGVLESAGGDFVTEQRIFIRVGDELSAHSLEPSQRLSEVDWFDPSYTYVSGKFDLYDPSTCVIEDYKVSGTFAFVYGKDSWEKQLNIYALGMRLLGHEVKGLRIVGICRDWDWRRASNSNYPQCPVVELEQELWDNDKAEHYIRNRLTAFQVAQGCPIDDMPPCDPEERWQRGECWALYKNKNKTASKLYYSEGEADAARASEQAENPKNTYRIEYRPPEDVRCTQLDYCKIKAWCPYWKQNYDKGR